MQFAWQHTRGQTSKEEVQPILEHEDGKASWLGQEATIITTQGRLDLPSPFSATTRLSQQGTFGCRHVQGFLSSPYHIAPIRLSCTFCILQADFATTVNYVQNIFACALDHVQGYITCSFGYVQSCLTCSFSYVSSCFA
jgi:hypothetical protein